MTLFIGQGPDFGYCS